MTLLSLQPISLHEKSLATSISTTLCQNLGARWCLSINKYRPFSHVNYTKSNELHLPPCVAQSMQKNENLGNNCIFLTHVYWCIAANLVQYPAPCTILSPVTAVINLATVGARNTSTYSLLPPLSEQFSSQKSDISRKGCITAVTFLVYRYCSVPRKIHL